MLLLCGESLSDLVSEDDSLPSLGSDSDSTCDSEGMPSLMSQLAFDRWVTLLGSGQPNASVGLHCDCLLQSLSCHSLAAALQAVLHCPLGPTSQGRRPKKTRPGSSLVLSCRELL